MVKCLPEFEYFYCVLENKNIIFRIRRSKVTDYAALRVNICEVSVYTERTIMPKKLINSLPNNK